MDMKQEHPPGPMPSAESTTRTAAQTGASSAAAASRGTAAAPDSSATSSSSHTRYHKRRQYEREHRLVTRAHFYSEPSSAGSLDPYHCHHPVKGQLYSDNHLLKRNLINNLDPIPFDLQWTEGCKPAYGWDIARKLEFLVTDPTVDQQRQRLEDHVRDFARTSEHGYRADTLDSLCVTLEYLERSPSLQHCLGALLQNLDKPILLDKASDIVTYFEHLTKLMAYLGCLLATLERQEHWELVSRAVLWQLAAEDSERGAGVVRRGAVLAAAAPVLLVTVVRMIAAAPSERFLTFLRIALLLACDSALNCKAMTQQNILENVLYRFNPYFPQRLPAHETSPADCQDHRLRLGDSSVHMSTTLSLLLVLLSTTLRLIQQQPDLAQQLPCPDCYALRCFTWVFRYECRARGRRHQRASLVAVAAVILRCFAGRLHAFSYMLMPDLLSLAVATEVPPRADWTASVPFDTSQQDVLFKKMLIYLCVDCIKAFPINSHMMECRMWLLGLTYLVDPGLCRLRTRWSPPLFAEIRKVALQALVLTLPLCAPQVITQYAIIRRILWYIEWYTESPFEIQVLYWCVRVLHVALHPRPGRWRHDSLRTLFNTHGIIILVQLCYTVMSKASPLPCGEQAVAALCLRVLESGCARARPVSCMVYPALRWPAAALPLALHSLDRVLHSLNKGYIVSDRWLVALLNFISEGVIWKSEYRRQFVADNGIYKLLDLITMCGPAPQCVALTSICDAVRAGEGAAQLVTWRAPINASNANPKLVSRGATIASLLAAIFRDECRREGVRLDDKGVLQEMVCPIQPSEIRAKVEKPCMNEHVISESSRCLAAAELAGSRRSKAFALLHLLSEDLEQKVMLADETYNLYHNVKLTVEDETVLVLCWHYLTLKLGEVWAEASCWSQDLIAHDQQFLEDFLKVAKGWSKEIKRQQEDVIARSRVKEAREESTLHAFLARVRLGVALDALREVKCSARASDRAALLHALLQDAVRALRRRRALARPLLRTYLAPPLDVQHVTGQKVKVLSIVPKVKPSPQVTRPSSSW